MMQSSNELLVQVGCVTIPFSYTRRGGAILQGGYGGPKDGPGINSIVFGYWEGLLPPKL